MKVRIIPYLSVTLQRYGYFGRWWDRTTWPRIWTLYPAPGHAFCLPDHHRSLTKESVLISGYQDPRAHSLLTTDKPSCFYGTQRAMIHFYQSCRETLTHLGDWVSCPMNAVTIWTGKLPLAQSLPSLCPPSFSLLAGHLLPSPPPKITFLQQSRLKNSFSATGVEPCSFLQERRSRGVSSKAVTPWRGGGEWLPFT